ncbi:hypothetical protein [Streptomyces varsoviensis]|uniref:hypothetical protein n=1 Tax=Streptomyces varsoviensis TaxID=67373 RepID=UPI0004C71D48|nr:hypothetical protein [Streptomyces varsoviensis]
MVRSLYGLDVLLDDLVPCLVGRERGGAIRVCAYREGNPVVELVGGRDTGKTALLDALFAAYKDQAPLARADFADSKYGEPGLVAGVHDEEAPNASPVTNLLYLVSHKLGLKAGAFHRPVRFPRLHLGLLVVTAWRPDGEGIGPPGLLRAQEELLRIVTEDRPDPRRRRAALRQWVDAVISNLGTLVPVFPGIDAVIAATLQSARDQLLTRPDRGALRWWGEHLPYFQGDGLQRLFASVWDFRRYGERRREAESLLVEAFLDDIAEHYGVVRKWNRAPRPLLLLDNGHTPAGRRFLDLLCERYGQGAGGSERPAVVVTALGDGRAHPPPQPDIRDLPREWPKISLGIPAVTGSAIRAMLNATPDYPAELPHLVERYSGGRTGSARLLADEAVRLRRSGERPDAARLLDAAAPRLLESLLPDAEARAALTFLAAARDRAAALRLWAAFHPDGDAAARVEQAMDHLATARLQDDRAVRALLLHQLAGDPRWFRVHLNLRAGYNPGGLAEYAPGHCDTYLHHTLALRRVEPVAHAMHRRFADTPPARWLASANLICAAPHWRGELGPEARGRGPGPDRSPSYPPSPEPPEALGRPPEPPPPGPPSSDPPSSDPSSPGPLPSDPPPSDPSSSGPPLPDPSPRPPACAACPPGEGPDDLHWAIRRLLTTVWRLSDPLSYAPRPEDIGTVRAELERLHQAKRSEDTTYRQAAQMWAAGLEGQVRAPDLRIPEGEGS